jgi:hypothetical protein
MVGLGLFKKVVAKAAGTAKAALKIAKPLAKKATANIVPPKENEQTKDIQEKQAVSTPQTMTNTNSRKSNNKNGQNQTKKLLRCAIDITNNALRKKASDRLSCLKNLVSHFKTNLQTRKKLK